MILTPGDNPDGLKYGWGCCGKYPLLSDAQKRKRLLYDVVWRHNNKIKDYKFWQDGNHPVELISGNFVQQKLHYIHNNPVVEGFVERPEEYLFSSARNYAEIPGLLDVVLV